MNTPKACPAHRENIAALVLGELDPATAERLIQHIDGCELCRGFRDALAAQEEDLRSAFDAITRRVERVEQLAERFGGSATQSETRAAGLLRRMIRGVRTMRPSRKILAAAAAIAITFTGLASWLIPGRSTPDLAFATVMEQIRIFRPYSCVYTYEYEGKSPFSYREMRLSLSRRREVRSDGTILVFDLSQQPNRVLTLDPARKSAVEQTLLDTGPRQDPDILRIVAGMRDGQAEDLGVKDIDGTPAHGFHRPDKINEFTIWADPKTGLPIRIELIQPAASRRLVMSEFDFNANLDESLFSTTAPEGYSVRQVEEDGVNPTESDLVEGLRVIATLCGGRFPAALTNETIEKALNDAAANAASASATAPSAEEARTMRLKAKRVPRFIDITKHFNKDNDLHYAGNGVRLGDAAAPVLWWKPATSSTFRVVYGDLSVRDVRAEDLPRPQGPGAALPSADVLKQARRFRPYSCLYTCEYQGKPPESHRDMHKTLSQRREEYPNGEVMVVDMSRRPVAILTLDPAKKAAVVRTRLNMGPQKDPDLFVMAADLQDGTAEDLGVKEVDGRLAHGFHKPDPINDLTVWADPKTGLPVRIELLQPTGSRRLIMSDFQFDVSFEESLFSTTAPAGYSVEKIEMK